MIRCSSLLPGLRPIFVSEVLHVLLEAEQAIIESQICALGTDGPCPAGSTAADADICRPDGSTTTCIARAASEVDHFVLASCAE